MSRIRYTLKDDSGESYDLTTTVRLDQSRVLDMAWVTFHPERGQFRIGAIAALLVDVRAIYAEALNEQSELPQLSERVVLELSDVLDDEDTAWMEHQAWLFGVELVVRPAPRL